MKVRLPLLLGLFAALFIVLLFAAFQYGLTLGPNRTISTTPSFREGEKPALPTSQTVPSQPPQPQTSNAPKPIQDFFDTINTTFAVSLTPEVRSEFYSPQGMISVTSWKLNLNPVMGDKSNYTKLLNLLESLEFKNTNAAAGGSHSIDEYQNETLICYYMTEGSAGEPAAWSKTDARVSLLCAQKEAVLGNGINPKVKEFYDLVNTSLNTYVEPDYVQKQYFYKNGQYQSKRVWRLNLNGFSRDIDTNIIENVFPKAGMKPDQTASAEGGPNGEFTYVYFNDHLICSYAFQKGTLDLACDSR